MLELLTSNVDTFVAGALGAFGGALGAQIIASRYQTKRSVVEELNSVSAAHGFCFAFCNRLLGLKKQHVRPMRDRFAEVEQEHQRHVVARRGQRGPDAPVFELHADLQTLTPPKISVETLEQLVFEKMRIRGRGLVAAVEFVGAFDGLEKSIAYRNALIAEIQSAAPPLTGRQLAERYLGLQTERGVVDERFRVSIKAIFEQTDDCIFFVRTLADDLLAHERKLRRRYAWRYWLRVPKLKPHDWSKAEAHDLIPPHEQYEDWLQGFRKKPTKLHRARSWLSSRFKRRVDQ
ncbi:MAG: hypothetical protein ACRECX_12145 [Methyloceanibacter sp.]|uniref:hypothetical protein n=1 Tax=Methyloceanibacter sp. TaxID=1965321 RepID=UPI003D6CDA67